MSFTDLMFFISLVCSVCSANCTNRGLACRMDNTQLCCHDECLAGCYGPGPGACVACKGALHRGVCVSQCPPDTYLFHGRRCVTALECFNMSSTYRLPHVVGSSGSSITGSGASVTINTTAPVVTTTVRQFAIHQGRCVPDCPSGHQRDEVSGHCVPCGDKCPRIRKPVSALPKNAPRLYLLLFSLTILQGAIIC